MYPASPPLIASWRKLLLLPRLLWWASRNRRQPELNPIYFDRKQPKPNKTFFFSFNRGAAATSTHAVVLLDLECVFQLLLARAALGTPPLQGHPGNPRPDQTWRQRQSGQGAHGVEHHLRADAAAQKHIRGTLLRFYIVILQLKRIIHSVDSGKEAAMQWEVFRRGEGVQGCRQAAFTHMTRGFLGLFTKFPWPCIFPYVAKHG